MSIRIVRLGSEREDGEGLRIGTVRRPPRGFRKEDFATRNYYDVWFPNLAPSQLLLSEWNKDEIDWPSFRRRFLVEMKKKEAQKDLDLLAALSHQTSFSVGCYCQNEERCHRSILRELLQERGADLRSVAGWSPDWWVQTATRAPR